jgi:hypothetical protein
VFFFERIFGDLLVTFWTCYLAARAKGAVLTVYGIPRFSDGFTPPPPSRTERRLPRDGFRVPAVPGEANIHYGKLLLVNRPHQNREKCP